MAAPEGVRVPTGLDDPPRFLFFDADLVAVVLTVTYLGAVLDHIGAGVFLGALSAYGWHKVSGLHGRGYGAALAYWHFMNSLRSRLKFEDESSQLTSYSCSKIYFRRLR